MRDQARFSWHVTVDGNLDTGATIQVDADSLELTDGALIFRLADYTSLIIAPGQWKAAAIMSQMDGYQNAYAWLKPPAKP